MYVCVYVFGCERASLMIRLTGGRRSEWWGSRGTNSDLRQTRMFKARLA